MPVSAKQGAQAQARLLLWAGVVFGYEREGIVLWIGKPGRSEHLAAQARARSVQLQTARAAEAEALQAAERAASKLRAARSTP